MARIIDGDILVSYVDLPYGIRRKGSCFVIPIEESEYLELKDKLDYIKYDNVYNPIIYFQITGRCNSKCKHCFAAVDNNPLVTEFSLEDMNKFLDECRDCGVLAFTITGGEPTVHRNFYEILDGIYKRGMTILDFNTNGYTLNQEMLDYFKKLNFDPNIKISFDGVGIHDYMRGVKGAEEKALNAMKLSIKNGFRTYSQTQVNKLTMKNMDETLEVLDKLGLQTVRLIKTTDTPRWEQNAKGNSYTFKEYYEEMLNLSEKYLSKKHNTELDIWEFISVDPKKLYPYGRPFCHARKCGENNFLCRAQVEMLSVGSNGDVYPCLEMQGVVDSFGYKYGNVIKDGLKSILKKDSKHYKAVHHDIEERMKHNKKCMECQYKDYCTGGCPGLGMVYSRGDLLGIDKSRCEFFETGIYKKIAKLLDYKNKFSEFYEVFNKEKEN